MSTESKGKQGDISSLSGEKQTDNFLLVRGKTDRQSPPIREAKTDNSPPIREAKTDNSPPIREAKTDNSPLIRGARGVIYPTTKP